MKLNPLKCSFGVASDKFLDFTVNSRGIEINPKQVRSIETGYCPKNKDGDAKLEWKVATLNRLISKATNKCIPLLDFLKKKKKKIPMDRRM